jgi:hypothetical protein
LLGWYSLPLTHEINEDGGLVSCIEAPLPVVPVQSQRSLTIHRLFDLKHKSHSYWVDEHNLNQILAETEVWLVVFEPLTLVATAVTYRIKCWMRMSMRPVKGALLNALRYSLLVVLVFSNS